MMVTLLAPNMGLDGRYGLRVHRHWPWCRGWTTGMRPTAYPTPTHPLLYAEALAHCGKEDVIGDYYGSSYTNAWIGGRF